MEMKPRKHAVTPEAVEHYIATGAAPGCEVALSSQVTSESFALGYFSDEGREAVTTDTLYDVASTSKLFTTALVLRLHEQGALSIDDRCANYLDNFKGSDVRLIDLLTHRVDFGVYLSEYRDKYPNEVGLRAALLNMKPPVAASPNIHYGNLEFIYLGKIIEGRTGKDLQTNMHELFRQLGLQRTSTGHDVATQRIQIPPTEVMDGKVISGITHDETARTLGGLAGNAGIFSTAEDLVRFGRAWLNGDIVTAPELVHRVFTDQDTSGLKPQGIGWWMRFSAPTGEQPTPGVFSHTGYTGSILVVSPETGKVAALTCNRTYYGRDNAQQRYIWQLLVKWADEA